MKLAPIIGLIALTSYLGAEPAFALSKLPWSPTIVMKTARMIYSESLSKYDRDFGVWQSTEQINRESRINFEQSMVEFRQKVQTWKNKNDAVERFDKYDYELENWQKLHLFIEELSSEPKSGKNRSLHEIPSTFFTLYNDYKKAILEQFNFFYDLEITHTPPISHFKIIYYSPTLPTKQVILETSIESKDDRFCKTFISGYIKTAVRYTSIPIFFSHCLRNFVNTHDIDTVAELIYNIGDKKEGLTPSIFNENLNLSLALKSFDYLDVPSSNQPIRYRNIYNAFMLLNINERLFASAFVNAVKTSELFNRPTDDPYQDLPFHAPNKPVFILENGPQPIKPEWIERDNNLIDFQGMSTIKHFTSADLNASDMSALQAAMRFNRLYACEKKDRGSLFAAIKVFNPDQRGRLLFACVVPDTKEIIIIWSEVPDWQEEPAWRVTFRLASDAELQAD